MIHQRVLEGSYQVMIVIGKFNGIFIAIFKANRLALIYILILEKISWTWHMFTGIFLDFSVIILGKKNLSDS